MSDNEYTGNAKSSAADAGEDDVNGGGSRDESADHSNANREEATDAMNRHRGFVRDAAVFHGKLFLDGLRDVLLFPAALIAAVVDVIRRDEVPGRYFYDVVHFGKQTEQWIDLFEAVDRAPPTERPRPTIDGPSVDELIDDLEARLRAEHEEGDIAASVKRAMDQVREAARKAMGASSSGG